jgi:hypothetical protein
MLNGELFPVPAGTLEEDAKHEAIAAAVRSLLNEK